MCKVGYKHTPEARAKMSAAKKGKQRASFSAEWLAEMSVGMKKCWESPEYRAKASAAQKGKKHSLGTLAKMSAARRGKKHSPETLAKMSVSAKARYSDPTKHPRWRGGVSLEPYAWTFNAELKEEVRRRDGYRCQLCGVSQAECRTKLPVHHVDYDKRNSDPVNLTALCGPCNSKVNANRKHWTKVFQAMAIARDIAALKERKSG